VITQKHYDDEYIAMLARRAGVTDPDIGNADHVRKALLHLARTKDGTRYRGSQPDDLGKPGQPPKKK
jgi:hypothetical protein